MGKRVIYAIILLIVFVSDLIVFDPSNGLIKGLPFGVELVLAVNVIIVALLGTLLIDTANSMWSDISDNEKGLVDTAIKQGDAGTIYLGTSIRMVAYAIVIAAAVVALN